MREEYDAEQWIGVWFSGDPAGERGAGAGSVPRAGGGGVISGGWW
ncbi:hypothetical protein Skr01_33190 [Sphaerisporangium krabiense]|nr:hypothetical protein Skr01_33190 [Sphaerisporangium krabiense]